jgi:hypothetical protein
MESVKADERVVGSAKKIRSDGQAFLGDQTIPLASGANQKDGAKTQRHKPEKLESRNSPAL